MSKFKLKRKRGVLLFLVLLSIISFLSLNTFPVYGALPSQIATTTNDWGFAGNSYQHKVFYAKGRYWVAYSDGTDAVYRTSTDGETWSSPTTLYAGVAAGYMFAWVFDGVYLHISLQYGQIAGRPLLYRRGTPQSDGSISWSAAWQTVVNEGGTYYHDPAITVDTNGRAWIGYAKYNGTGSRYAYVTANANSDGTWTTRSGFPYECDPNGDAGNPGWYVIPVNMSNNHVIVFKHGWNQPILRLRYLEWDGSSWVGSWANATTNDVDQGSQVAITSLPNDDIYIHYLWDWNPGNPETYFVWYDDSEDSWSSPVHVASGASPKLNYDPTYNSLYFIWSEWQGGTEQEQFQYRRYNVDSGAWGPVVDWFSPSGDWLGGDRTSDMGMVFEDRIGFVYTMGSGSPYTGYFNLINVSAQMYEYTFEGLYSEYNGIKINSGVNATVYVDGYDPETFLVNGTTVRGFYGLPRYASFDLPNNPDREYWFSSGETGTTIYIYTDTSLTEYVVSFLDLAGALDDYPFVEAQLSINGTYYVVERRKVDVEKKVLFSLKEGRKYSIRIEDGSSYTFGDLLMTSTTTVTLTLKGIEFPKETLLAYKYVRVYVTRAFATPNGNITVTYQDTLGMTNKVEIFINYRNGTNAYNATETAQSFSHTWSSADNSTSYRVEINIDHQKYGTYTVKQFLPRHLSTNPWGLDFLGNLPFATNILIPMFIILLVGGSFSVLNADLGAFMATITAIIVVYMWDLDIPTSFLIVAFTFSICMGIIFAKRKIQT